jgi:carboxymethylenebutenolidase
MLTMSIGNSLSALLSQHQVRKTTDAFLSGNTQIHIDRFLPLSDKQFPAVIALHGSGGMRESFSQQPARMLAASGYAVFLLHYFERTGTSYAYEPAIRQNFPAWMETISDAMH